MMYVIYIILGFLGLVCIILTGFLVNIIIRYNTLRKKFDANFNILAFFSLKEKDCEIQYSKFFGNIKCQVLDNKLIFVISTKDDKDIIKIPLDKIQNYSFDISFKSKLQ